MKKQIVVIHGGDTFETYEEYLSFLREYKIDIEKYKADKKRWRSWIRKELGRNYEVIIPEMPNDYNAKYEEWKLWFEKLFQFLNEEVILVGHSLGCAFLAKYLSENKFPKKIKGVFMVAGVYDKDCDGYGLVSFALPNKLDLQTENIYLYHSEDDPVVPLSALNKYKQALPKAHTKVFNDRGHFAIETFPEIVEDIIGLWA